jgi:transcriptional regulator with XRE-family HTH domain
VPGQSLGTITAVRVSRSLSRLEAMDALSLYPEHSIRDIAKRFGVGKTTIHKLLRGERYVDVHDLVFAIREKHRAARAEVRSQ